MQIWVLLPLIYALLKKSRILIGGGILLITSIIGDFILEKYIGFSPGFICFRYLFLCVPAYMYLKGVKMKEIWFLILISEVYLSLILYSGVPDIFDPILPNGWETQTSLGFFYTLFLFVILSKNYEKVRTQRIAKYMVHLGTISWEIFLVQMVLLGSVVVEFVNAKLFQSAFFQVGFKVLMVLTFSLLFAQLYKKFIERFLLK